LAEAGRYKEEAGAAVFITDAQSMVVGLDENKAVFVRSLHRLLTALREARKKVIIVGPVPEIGHDVPERLAMQQLATEHVAGAQERIAPTYAEFSQRQDFVLKTIKALAAEFGVRFILSHQILCVTGVCKIESQGQPLYTDDNHLSRSAALAMRPMFEPVFR
jgi:hypothetical protein